MDKEELLVIEPIIGYREWNIKLFKIKGKYELRLVGVGIGEQFGYWNNGIIKAICLKKLRHKVPDFNCECGFYTKKYKIDFIKELLNTGNSVNQFGLPTYTLSFSNGLVTANSIGQDNGVEHISIYGIVELLGRVIEHSEGYRAERVNLKKLLFVENGNTFKFQYKQKIKKKEKKIENKQEGGAIDSHIGSYSAYFLGTWTTHTIEDNYEIKTIEFKKEEIIKQLQEYYQVPIIYYKDYLERELLK